MGSNHPAHHSGVTPALNPAGTPATTQSGTNSSTTSATLVATPSSVLSTQQQLQQQRDKTNRDNTVSQPSMLNTIGQRINAKQRQALKELARSRQHQEPPR